MGTEYRGWSQWSEKFKPMNNRFNSTENSQLFDISGDEVEFVKAQDEKHVWTLSEQDDLSEVIMAGYHFRNRMGYYITEVPWTDEWDSCLISVEEKCDCYEESSDCGDTNCNKCKGSGFTRLFLG
jgi:hypothetical protein